MPLKNTIVYIRRSRLTILSRQEAKAIIYNLKNFNKFKLPQVLDIIPQIYKTKIVVATYKGLYIIDKEKTNIDLFTKKNSEKLYSKGERLAFFYYSTIELKYYTIYLCCALKKKFLDLFLFNYLELVKRNNASKEIYYPDYTELKRIVV